MGSNQRKVSVNSTHMPVSGAGDFNKGIQMGDLCVCDLDVCMCAVRTEEV